MIGVEAIEKMELDDLGYSFGPKIKPMFVGLNYSFIKGGSYWIKAASGAGKSSLLKVLVALASPWPVTYALMGWALRI